MEFTGEQVVPHVSKKRLIDEDVARYEFALSYCDGKEVLDIASGTGLGTHMLSQNARSVVGVDISEESILYANTHHAGEKISYCLGSATNRSLFPQETFDTIISFETIEHLNDTERKEYLSNLSYWLRPDGILVLSTPNKRVTSPFGSVPENRFHVLEFTREILAHEVGEYFNIDSWLSQRQVPKWLCIPLVRRGVQIALRLFSSLRSIYTLSGSAEVISYNEETHEPRIFVIVCRKK